MPNAKCQNGSLFARKINSLDSSCSVQRRLKSACWKDLGTLCKEVSVTRIGPLHVTSPHVIEWKLPSLRSAKLSWLIAVAFSSVRNVKVVMKVFQYTSCCRVPGTKTKELPWKRHQAWISSLNRRDWALSKSSHACSEHFLSGKF